MTALLEVESANAYYGSFRALFDLDLRVEEGETVAVVGANGAGKTTLLRTITGLLDPARGSVKFAGQDLRGIPAHQRAIRGIAMVPEGRKLFPSLTVEENLLMGGYRAQPGHWNLAAVYELFPLVEKLRRRRAAALSGGEQQAVAIGRALMGNPRLLLLDEVSLGLAPVVVRQLYAALPAIRGAGNGTGILIVEQDVHQAMAVADRVYCLLEGRSVLEGRATELNFEQVAAAYFGGRHDLG
jgi:branched-chain amino acid transport system ATP-binding protein